LDHLTLYFCNIFLSEGYLLEVLFCSFVLENLIFLSRKIEIFSALECSCSVYSWWVHDLLVYNVTKFYVALDTQPPKPVSCPSQSPCEGTAKSLNLSMQCCLTQGPRQRRNSSPQLHLTAIHFWFNSFQAAHVVTRHCEGLLSCCLQLWPRVAALGCQPQCFAPAASAVSHCSFLPNASHRVLCPGTVQLQPTASLSSLFLLLTCINPERSGAEC